MSVKGLWVLGWLVVLSVEVAKSEDEVLTAHIIAHSHCDPGWLSTFEGYYTSDVNRILSNAMQQLKVDPARRFIWAEISFFSRWYEDQGVDTKKAFRQMVEEGRWEFVGGGWAQNDEGAADPILVVNQMTAGHQYLLENFGVTPRIGWQIDPFGHSSITPTLFKEMGFDALVINRIHHMKKASYKKGRLMEFIWRGARLGDTDVDMFTHVLHTHYSAPKGFDWEEGAPQVNGRNVEARAQVLVGQLKQRANAYRSPHLLVPFGDDFKFKNAANQFQNMDALIKHINANENRFKVRLRYSTVTEYFRAVHEWAREKTAEFPLFMGDFFPYADNEDSYWTGYYTTRPFLKKLSRQVESTMRSAEALYALTRANVFINDNAAPAGLVDKVSAAQYWMQTYEHLRTARHEAAIFSHHDAITGTCRSTVANDYVNRMNRALNTANGIVESYLALLLTANPEKPPKLTHARRVLEKNDKGHAVVIYNSLSFIRSEIVAISVETNKVYVMDPDGNSVESQIDKQWASPSDKSPSTKTYTLRFTVNVPPLGASTYMIFVLGGKTPDDLPKNLSPAASSKVTEYSQTSAMDMLRGAIGATDTEIERGSLSSGDSGGIILENEVFKVEVNSKCLVGAITDKRHGDRRVKIDQSLKTYRTKRSGAYIFRPEGSSQPAPNSEKVVCRVFKGPVVDVVKGFSGSEFEFEMLLARGGSVLHTLGLEQHLTVSVPLNQELITHVNTNLKSGKFVATHNGVEFLARERVDKKNKYSHNFWPSIYGVRVAESSSSQTNPAALTILNSHAVGAGTQGDGQIELMLHRQLGQDDGRGLSEAVRDASRPEIRLWFSLDSAGSGGPAGKTPHFDLQRLRLNNQLHVLLDAQGVTENLNAIYKPRFAPLAAELPGYIHIMSLMVRDGATDDVILRIRSLSSSSKSFNLPLTSTENKLFANIKVDRPGVTSLTANHQGRAFEDAHSYAISSETVDDATKRIDKSQKEETTSQNTDEEGVFLSKSALERSRKLLGISPKTVEAVIPAGGIVTYNLMLSDSLSEDERKQWLEKEKDKFPVYAESLARPKAVIFSPSIPQSGNLNPMNRAQKIVQQPQHPHAKPAQRPPTKPNKFPKADVTANKPAVPILPAMPEALRDMSRKGEELSQIKHNAMHLVVTGGADQSLSGFEYGFVMGAVTVAGLCLIVHLNVVNCGLDDYSSDRKKFR
mmetsp:Transcript_3054/g.4548  ORF Transcript_3054/g.4548 Transcript_3054/m.4548 type:complete len:1202 (+) Transcript_3054:113-3718(+)|eukprot:CAMPEP_0167754842 /NCGR_PEP_ID=MMETSP0110_2-20121227/8495_1 /TAXON_ID=629695 /ORGANISM="Gymnochlora sp., Strain CCMP2014" /LENGTH=1201 /DNA_ID=CAMNT_0007640767 /DNA_START=198 /DNA_END=3803 /DNA_ORIENTATION=+